MTVAVTCRRCGWRRDCASEAERRELYQAHAAVCPALRRPLERALHDITQYVQLAEQRAQRAVSEIDWASRDPDGLPLSAVRTASEDLRAALVLAELVRVHAAAVLGRVERVLLELERERQRRLDREYEWPTGYPPVPVV